MAYDLDQLILKFRREMEDTVEPYLGSDDEITDYLDEAEEEVAEDINIIPDQITIPYSADDVWLDVPAYVTRVREAETSGGYPVGLANHEEWPAIDRGNDYGVSILGVDWKTRKDARVRYLITDTLPNQYRMYPIPNVDGSIVLSVYRVASNSLDDRGAFAVASSKMQRCMLLKVKSLALWKHDSEVFNPNLANEYEAKFKADLLELKTRVQRQRRRTNVTTYGGL